MTDFPDRFLFMKVGTHAQEELSQIVKRKREEIDRAGFTMWGYGGNTCHPTTMVQPFAKLIASQKQPILLYMHPMTSRHFAEPVRATEYSSDGITWERVPDEIDVVGSRYALWIKSLDEAHVELPLSSTRVAIGNSRGKTGTDYIRGHVDKACFEFVRGPRSDNRAVSVRLVAEVLDPYAVFLRS